MERNPIYTPSVIAMLESNWELGWLSPGGVEDVTELVSGINLAGKSILDFGVGTGGPASTLISKFGVNHVTGIDVEQAVLDRTKRLFQENGLEKQIDLKLVVPGRLPFADNQFDIVFSKDVFLHIADKSLLFDEIFRVLQPGGWCVFSDWCCGTPPYSQEMEQFLDNGMNFSMATLGENCEHLKQAGFRNIAAKDRNIWFAELACREYQAAKMKRSQYENDLGVDVTDRLIAAAKRRTIITQQGHLRPTHFQAQK